MERRCSKAGRQLAVLLLSASAACLSVPAVAEVELQSEGMTVYGQSELPKVLYIVPWKRREAKEIDMPKTKSLVSDVLAPIDPDIFRRQIRYHALMQQQLKDSK